MSSMTENWSRCNACGNKRKGRSPACFEPFRRGCTFACRRNMIPDSVDTNAGQFRTQFPDRSCRNSRTVHKMLRWALPRPADYRITLQGLLCRYQWCHRNAEIQAKCMSGKYVRECPGIVSLLSGSNGCLQYVRACFDDLEALGIYLSK